MRFRVDRYGIYIIPESPKDEAYIEDTLGLKHEGDAIRLVRYDADNGLGHLCTKSDAAYKLECSHRAEAMANKLDLPV